MSANQLLHNRSKALLFARGFLHAYTLVLTQKLKSSLKLGPERMGICTIEEHSVDIQMLKAHQKINCSECTVCHQVANKTLSGPG